MELVVGGCDVGCAVVAAFVVVGCVVAGGGEVLASPSPFFCQGATKQGAEPAPQL